jgi:hypothetical protein
MAAAPSVSHVTYSPTTPSWSSFSRRSDEPEETLTIGPDPDKYLKGLKE